MLPWFPAHKFPTRLVFGRARGAIVWDIGEVLPRLPGAPAPDAIEPAANPSYSGCLRKPPWIGRRAVALAALCLIVALTWGIASAHAQEPGPDPAPAPAPDPAPMPEQPPPPPAPPPAAPPPAPPPPPVPPAPPAPLAATSYVGDAGRSGKPPRKREPAKRKKPDASSRAVAAQAIDRGGPAVVVAVAPVQQLARPGSQTSRPLALLAWLVIGIGGSVLLAAVVLVMSGRLQR
jgi:hypothetical protein